MEPETEAKALSFLLQASSKEQIAVFFNSCFRQRDYHTLNTSLPIMDDLKVQEPARELVLQAGILLVKRVLYVSDKISSASVIHQFVPPGVDKRLVDLISNVIFASIPAWRDAAADQRVGLPRLEKVDWLVDIKNSSSNVLSLSEPSVVLNLSIRDLPSKVGEFPESHNVVVNLNSAALSSLVTDMRKVKDILSGLSA